MRLASVNVARARPLEGAKGLAGIFKEPVAAPDRVSRAGIEGDAVCDAKNHGGPDQALYLYGTPDYAWFSAKLGRALAPGTFGENLTIDGLESAQVAIGDRFRVGNVLLEVSAPRIPCATLAARMNDLGFVKRFRAAERPGLYCRVIETGTLQAGDAVFHEPYAAERVLVLELFRAFYDPAPSEAVLRRYLCAPIAARTRADTEARLQKLAARSR